ERHAVHGGERAEFLDDAVDLNRVHGSTRSRTRRSLRAQREPCPVSVSWSPQGQQHVRGHPDREAAILVVDAEADFEGLDVALGAADVALRRKSRVDAAIEGGPLPL